MKATACATCASLRAAAVQLVGDRGFRGLSVGALCEACALTPQEFADHYATPSACLYDAYDRLSQDLLDEVQDAYESAPTGPDAVNGARARLLTRLAERPAETRLLFDEALHCDRELRQRRDEGRQRMVSLMLSERRRRLDLQKLSRVQIELLLGASFHLIATRVAEGRIAELTDLDRELAELTEMFDPPSVVIGGSAAAA